jgi:hypothetical protein
MRCARCARTVFAATKFIFTRVREIRILESLYASRVVLDPWLDTSKIIVVYSDQKILMYVGEA